MSFESAFDNIVVRYGKDEFGNKISTITVNDHYTDKWFEIASLLHEDEFIPLSIEKITNLNNEKKYNEKKDYDLKNIGHTNEKCLYHVSKDNDDSICNFNFDIRQSRRGLFGRGLYFASNISKCNFYRKRNTPINTLYITQVNLGRVFVFENGKINHTLFKAPDGYDSIRGNPKNIVDEEEYVIYENERVLPKYKITYIKPPKKEDFVHYQELYIEINNLKNKLQKIKSRKRIKLNDIEKQITSKSKEIKNFIIDCIKREQYLISPPIVSGVVTTNLSPPLQNTPTNLVPNLAVGYGLQTYQQFTTKIQQHYNFRFGIHPSMVTIKQHPMKNLSTSTNKLEPPNLQLRKPDHNKEKEPVVDITKIEIPLKLNNYTCNICNKSYLHSSSLKRHLQSNLKPNVIVKYIPSD